MSFTDRVSHEKHLLSFPAAPYGPVGMMYPNLYGVGMASLGYQQIYRLFSESGFAVERVFWDKKGRETRSLENRIPLFRFPVLASSYTYELDIIHILQMLIRGGVAPLREDRGEESPILIVGGQAATANVRLLTRIADVVAMGEGEALTPNLAQALAETQGQPRETVLRRIADTVRHVYVPSLHGAYDPILHTAHTLDPLDSVDCHSVILAEADEFSGAFLLEMSRGCMYRCKFCIVHYMNGSARYRDYDRLIGALDRHQDQFSKVGLLGAAVADHPRVEDVTEWLVRRGKQVATSSLRAERISERFLELLREGGQHNITVAPETGGIESRKRMRKGVTDEKYFRLAEMAGKRGFPSMKLYFVIGTPESDVFDEATEIVQFGRAMNEVFTKSGGGRLTITVSPFVPKPTTPWAEGSLWDARAVKKASRIIRKELAFRENVKVPPVNVKEALAETALSWAGEEITGELIDLAMKEDGLESAFSNFDFSTLARDAGAAALPHETELAYMAKVNQSRSTAESHSA
ncbi:MAG: radical SAM protein [bacterium]|nr:radical SAM protein [bacterium]